MSLFLGKHEVKYLGMKRSWCMQLTQSKFSLGEREEKSSLRRKREKE